MSSFDFKSRDFTFYKAILKRRDVSSMQPICMIKQRILEILPFLPFSDFL